MPEPGALTLRRPCEAVWARSAVASARRLEEHPPDSELPAGLIVCVCVCVTAKRLAEGEWQASIANCGRSLLMHPLATGVA